MVAFLKVFQETWLDAIVRSENMEQIKAVCQEIYDDDTGDTDELCQALAKIILDK